jgi:hypothetical protein
MALGCASVLSPDAQLAPRSTTISELFTPVEL